MSLHQFADGSIGFECGVQCQPELEPQQAAGDLLFHLAADLVVVDLQEALDEILIVAQNFVEDTERIHWSHPQVGS